MENLPDTRSDRGFAKTLPKGWYTCDYNTFLKLLEAREKELGISHEKTSQSRQEPT